MARSRRHEDHQVFRHHGGLDVVRAGERGAGVEKDLRIGTGIVYGDDEQWLGLALHQGRRVGPAALHGVHEVKRRNRRV